MAARKHVHKYYFGLEVAGTKVWSCALPECVHYMPNHMAGVVNGRLGKCWKCGDNTIIDIDKIKTGEYEEGKVFCDDCIILLKGRDSIITHEKTDEERKAELMKPVIEAMEAVKCKKCQMRTAMTSMSHGLCASCAFESI
jgi:hypothetical protein